MNNRFLLALILLLFISVTSIPVANGALISYTSRASWEAAVGTFVTEDFNSITTDTVFTNSSLAFADLTLRSTGGATAGVLVDLPTYEYNPGTADIDGTARVNLGGIYSTSTVTIDFDFGVSAVGFDTVNYDAGNDSAEALVFMGAQLIGYFPELRGQTGFIGVIETTGADLNPIDIQGDIYSTFNAFDNVSYGHTPVPEPATMLLLGTGLVGLVGFRRKKFKK